MAEHGADGAREKDEAPRGRVDLVSILYILGGIPAIVAYVWICFILASWFNFPA